MGQGIRRSLGLYLQKERDGERDGEEEDVSFLWVGKIPWRRERLPTPVFLGFPGGSTGKETACNVVDLGLIPGLGRSPGEGNGNPFQYSCLENPMDGEAW